MTAPRIMVPTLFGGNWDSVIICTFSADLVFYERDLWRQVERARNRIVFADGNQVARKFADPDNRARLRQVNRTYVLAPIEIDHAAHAKLILLLREDRGLLAVGSGNLAMTGYASQGECFTTYEWSEDHDEHLGAFVAAKEFVGGLLDRGLVDSVVRPRVQQAWQDAPWIYGSVTATETPVRHNLDRPLLDQLIEMIGERQVNDLIVHAPFYDHQCTALHELLKRTKPRQLTILLQERITSVDPKYLAKALASAPGTVDVRSVEAHERGTFLHAKFMIARCRGVDVCLQGSPNLSTPALLRAFPAGNIELANLLTGKRGEFDHLVTDLRVSAQPVDVATLGLGLTQDDDVSDSDVGERCVRELVWIPPRLTGVFNRSIEEPPILTIGDEPIDGVSWDLEDPIDGTTRFTGTLSDRACSLLSRVEAVAFIFDGGEPTASVYPYHLNSLIALASGQGRTDLLKQAGDFDLGDEELEQLLSQLDEVLVVDGRSIWRMLKRKAPEPVGDDESHALSYEDLDWDAIQSHPKLAQYRTWDQHGRTDPSGLGILLTSIADRFRTDLERRRSGRSAPIEGPDASDPLDDLSATIDAEDEEVAEAENAASEKRRTSARARAKRQFHTFVKRFVNGIQDDEFVRLVGPSVIVPSYVVFNHLCWKLIQVDLADERLIVDAQAALWRFFWGEPEHPGGYLATMSTAEQEAALAILDRHHAEAVLLCSMYQAYDVAWSEGTERDIEQVRDAWRNVLDHPLWQPTTTALMDAATILQPLCESAEDLVEELDRLASFMTEQEPLRAIERTVGSRPGTVRTQQALVRRAHLGNQPVTAFVIDDASACLTRHAAEQLISTLRAMLPDDEHDYIRIEHPSSNVVAFADYATDTYVYADKNSDTIDELERPEPAAQSWRPGVDGLYELAS